MSVEIRTATAEELAEAAGGGKQGCRKLKTANRENPIQTHMTVNAVTPRSRRRASASVTTYSNGIRYASTQPLTTAQSTLPPRSTVVEASVNVTASGAGKDSAITVAGSPVRLVTLAPELEGGVELEYRLHPTDASAARSTPVWPPDTMRVTGPSDPGGGLRTWGRTGARRPAGTPSRLSSTLRSR